MNDIGGVYSRTSSYEQVTAPSSGDFYYRLMVPDINNLYYLTPGETYTFSGSASHTSGELKFRSQCSTNGSSWNVPDDISDLGIPTSDGSIFKQFSHTFTIPDGATGIYFSLQNYDYTAGSLFRFKNMKLEKGSVATPWSLSQSELTTTTGAYKGVTLNDRGLTAIAGSTKVAMNSNDGFLINNAGNEVFHVDTAGNLTMKGNITAGNISGVTLTGNNLNLNGTLAIGANGVLSANGGKTVINNSGLTIKDGGLSIKDSKGNQTTYVGSDGTLITNKGYFIGTVTTSALNVTGSNSDINLGGGKFHVDKYGNLTANSATLVNGIIASATLNSATINSPDIIVPFDSFDASQNEYKGSMEFKDGLIKHISTMADGGMLKTVITPIGYELNAYANQSEYTKNNPFIHSELYADNISVSNSDTRKSGILDSSGIAGTLNNGTDQSNNISVIWEDVRKYLPEMSDTGNTRAFDWFDMMSSVQSHPNLLRNSSFVNGKNNWDIGSAGYVSNDVHDGNFVLQMVSPGGSNFCTQTLANFPWAGNQVCVSFWANIVRNDGGVNGGAFIDFIGGGMNYTMTIQDAGKGLSAGWKFYSFNPITVPNGTNSIRFSFYNNEHNGNMIYFAQPMLNAGSHVAPYMPTY